VAGCGGSSPVRTTAAEPVKYAVGAVRICERAQTELKGVLNAYFAGESFSHLKQRLEVADSGALRAVSRASAEMEREDPDEAVLLARLRAQRTGLQTLKRELTTDTTIEPRYAPGWTQRLTEFVHGCYVRST
jgi:hypothetical protein